MRHDSQTVHPPASCVTVTPMLTISDLERHRSAIAGHCYRMLGSVTDADDAVQETMLRAWRHLDGFEGRSSVRTWLYRIATRVCLDAIDERKRRSRSMDLQPVGTIDDPLVALPASTWIEPMPDVDALPADADPHELVSLKQSLRLAFVAALQHLPPRQRAALLLVEVLGWSAAEVASGLEMTVAAVNSALQRARATLASRHTGRGDASLSADELALVDRYVHAFERYDVDALTALMHEDATMSMPPFSLWLQGRASYAGWLLGRGIACRGSRVVRTAANGLPAFAQYKPAGDDRYLPWAIVVLEIERGAVANQTVFLDTATLFPRFGLPAELSMTDARK
jgi:RNA polymerase sigma-70 factor (ECF subfamily)